MAVRHLQQTQDWLHTRKGIFRLRRLEPIASGATARRASSARPSSAQARARATQRRCPRLPCEKAQTVNPSTSVRPSYSVIACTVSKLNMSARTPRLCVLPGKQCHDQSFPHLPTSSHALTDLPALHRFASNWLVAACAKPPLQRRRHSGLCAVGSPRQQPLCD